MPSLSIQNRFAVYTSLLLFVAFFVFTTFVASLPNQMHTKLDQQLQDLARGMVEQAQQQDELEWSQQLDWPSDQLGYRTASSFFVVISKEEDENEQEAEVVKYSPNLNEAVALDPTVVTTDKVQVTTRRIKGDTLRVYTYPIFLLYGDNKDSRKQVGVLQVGQLISEFNQFMLPSFLIGFSGLLASFAIVSLIAPTILSPLEKITLVAQHITTADDLSNRIPDATGDELGALVKVLNQLMERMETLFQTQQRFLADVSHELRTPLTAIRGNVDLMRMMGKVDVDSLNAIEMESMRMSRLVDDLLTLARADAGGLPIRRELLSLDRLVLEVYEQILYLKAPVRVILKNASPAYVMGDPDRLKQLLINLMTNAVKYTDPGGAVQVSLTIVPDQQYAKFTVIDTGIGISKKDLPHIFDRFYRVNEARTRERGGSGLGLSIVKSIVDAHRGVIKVESDAGVGSTFTVLLPLAKEHAQLVTDQGQFDSEFEE